MLQRFSELSPQLIVVETRPQFVDDATLETCVACAEPARLVVELGVESLDPWVLKYCINKETAPGSVEDAVRRIHEHGALATANVLVGAPFLTLEEQIEDSIRTLRGVLAMGFETAVVFPVNVKHHTLVGWLWKRGLYRQPSLWALIDVLKAVEADLLPRIVVSWYRPRPNHPGDPTPYLGPSTCPRCYPTVMGLLDRWRGASDHSALLREIDALRCDCRTEYLACGESSSVPLTRRVREQHHQIAVELLDADFLPFIDLIPEHHLGE
jgi:radical SAM enzyme (TIGR01210 family)